eukprot:m.197671 g.197671  ORF g.197671 m.197671 type:complete len:390 (+) comp20189_c0_seq1:119-1288(+)
MRWHQRQALSPCASVAMVLLVMVCSTSTLLATTMAATPVRAGVSQGMEGGGQRKYLRWWREWLHCAGLMHQRASFACMLSEAKRLNRTAIIQSDYCMHSVHTHVGKDTYVPLGRMYNLRAISEEVQVLLREGDESVERLVKRDLARRNMSTTISLRRVDSSFRTRNLINEPATIVTRTFDKDYWYELCGASSKGNPELTDESLKESVYNKVNTVPDTVVDLARAIAKRIGGPFSYIHVRRGDKVRATNRWPHLDRDTRGAAILASPVFRQRVPSENAVYLATDERDPTVFSTLFQKRRAYTLANFTHVVPGLAKLSAYEINLVDFTLRTFADPKHIETFNHLTCDEKHGQGAPRSCECGPRFEVKCERPKRPKKRKKTQRIIIPTSPST